MGERRTWASRKELRSWCRKVRGKFKRASDGTDVCVIPISHDWVIKRGFIIDLGEGGAFELPNLPDVEVYDVDVEASRVLARIPGKYSPGGDEWERAFLYLDARVRDGIENGDDILEAEWDDWYVLPTR